MMRVWRPESQLKEPLLCSHRADALGFVVRASTQPSSQALVLLLMKIFSFPWNFGWNDDYF